MGLFGDILGAVAGPLVSGLITSEGGRQQNEANVEQAERARQFNSAEALASRQWQAGRHDIAMDYSAKQAKISRNWMENLSNTSHYREVQDLKSAGLNPILSSKYGGASTPSAGSPSSSAPGGATASGPMARMENILGPGVASAMARERLDYETKVMSQNVAKGRAEVALINEKKRTEEHMGEKVNSEKRRLDAAGALDYQRSLNEPTIGGKLEAETSESRQRIRASQQHVTNLEIAAQQERERLKGMQIEGKINESELALRLGWIDRFISSAKGALGMYPTRGRRH